MIKGIGVDVVEIKRIKQAVEKYGRSFLTRVYSPAEIGYCSSASKHRFPELAVRFAAKEAYAKALGTGIGRGVFWKDIEVLNDKLGRPELYIKGKKAKRAHLSLSHSQEMAVAVVVIEGK